MVITYEGSTDMESFFFPITEKGTGLVQSRVFRLTF